METIAATANTRSPTPISDAFVCEPRGVVTVKGKGEMPTYLLIGRRPETVAG